MTDLTSQLVPDRRDPAGDGGLFAAGPHASLAEHERVFGPLRMNAGQAGPADLSFTDVVEQSGLTGRGGAAFAAWRKLAATGQSRGGSLPGGRPVVVANGAEGEPLSFKDKALLAHAPHLVLDGLLAAGRAVSASKLYLYSTAAVIPAVESALAERRDTRRVEVVQAPETFISGEASAVVNAIGNGRAVPVDRRRRLSESGLKGRPTLVLNVETMAHLALIGRYGASWFRSAGSVGDPGTRLVSISGGGAERVLEIAGGAVLGTVLAQAGIELSTVQAVLVGGYHGRWVTSLDCRLSPGGPDGQAVSPGAGVLHVLSGRQCGLETTARILEYLAGESAKQCGPCMFGLPAMSGLMKAIAGGGRDPRLTSELERLGHLVSGRGACHHPDGTAQLVRSALNVFSADVIAHRTGTCTRMTWRMP